MSTSLLLRIASVISFLFAAGHSLGGRKNWSPQGDNQVLDAMRTVRFNVFGVSRSYLDFYRGFGFTLGLFLLLQAVLLWQLAGIARTDAAQVKGMIAAFAIAALGCGILSWKFILPSYPDPVLGWALGRERQRFAERLATGVRVAPCSETKIRRARFTAVELRKRRARSGASTTMFVPSANRFA